MARFVAGGEFGFAAERNGGGGSGARRGARIDHGGVFASAVKGEHLFAEGFVNDRIGIIACRRRADGGVGFQIEDRDRFALAIAGEAATEVRDNRDAVHAGRFLQIADELSRFSTDDLRVRLARDVEQLGGGIDGQIIPAAFPADGKCLGN